MNGGHEPLNLYSRERQRWQDFLNTGVLSYNTIVAEGQAQQGVQAQQPTAIPDVSAMQHNANGGTTTADLRAFDEEQENHRVRDSDREARGRKRSPACLYQTRPEGKPTLGVFIGPEEPPRKLPKCEIGSEGQEVLHEGGGLYCRSPLHSDDEAESMEDSTGSSEDGSDEGSDGDTGDFWGADVSGLDDTQLLDIPDIRAFEAQYRTTMRTAIDEIRQPLRMGGESAYPYSLWVDQHGENDTSRFATTPSIIRQPFRPPSRAEGSPGGDFRRHELQASARRSSDPPSGLGDGQTGPRTLSLCRNPSWDAKDYNDEQMARRGTQPGKPSDCEESESD